MINRPTQVVILAGGRGSRLAPLTDFAPKPMVPFQGRPFLEYLIEMLCEQGFDRIVLLLGYRAESVMDHFGDGSCFGIDIIYSIAPLETETGKRIKLAEDHFDPLFLLLYCDNYWPMPFEDMWRHYQNHDASTLVTVFSNEDLSTRDNLKVGDDGLVEVYDKSRQAANLKGVDIGFMILRRETIEAFPDGNISFEATLYPELVKRRQLLAYRTRHKYYSVGDLVRLPATEKFLARQPAIILDRDGVLNVKMPKAEYVKSWDDWTWAEGALEALSLLTDAGYRIIVITNQAGIARGVMSEDDLMAIHEQMIADTAEAGGKITAIYYCPHGWCDGCDCRKPSPGMLHQAQQDFVLDLSRTIFIGDDDRDGEAANAAFCRFEKVTESRSLLNVIDDLNITH